MDKPKILIWDLETGGVNAFKPDLGMILCFGYKWLGESETHVMRVCDFKGWFSKETGVNDKPLVAAMLDVMAEADLLVAHYGDKFDRRFFQGRVVMHGYVPPPPSKQRDTYRIARRAFAFGRNRLGYLATFMGLSQQKYQKKASEWPGWWIQAMAGNKASIAAMGEYCKQDVRTLEQIYLRIRPYDYEHPRLYQDGKRPVCRLCGGSVQYHGLAYLKNNRYRRYQCTLCGTWDRERKAYVEPNT